MDLTPTQQDTQNILIDKIDKEDFPIFITGGAGSGKTKVIKEWMRKNEVGKLQYYDNNIIEEIVNTYKPVIQLQESSEQFSFFKLFWKSGISAYHLWYLIRKREKSHKRSLETTLTPGLYNIFFLIDKMMIRWSKKKHVDKSKEYRRNIIVFDEVNFWDDFSLEALNSFLFNEEIKKVFPRLKTIKPIIIYTQGYHVPEKLADIISKSEKSVIRLKEFTEDDLKFLFNDLPPKASEHIRSSIQTIRNLSLSSNLFLVKSIANYILKNKLVKLDKIEDLKNCFEKYFYKENYLENILTVSTIPDEPVLWNEVNLLAKKVHQYEYETVDREISKAISKKFLFRNSSDTDTITINFIHEEYKKYFAPKNEEEQKKYFANYAEVLREISPGDYLERATYYKLADNMDMFYIYMSMEAIQKSIQDIPCRISNKDLGPYHKFVVLIAKGYRLFYQNKKKELIMMLDEFNLTTGLPPLLRFEKEYLVCRSNMQSGDQEVFASLDSIIEKILEDIDKKEKEVYVRANMLAYISSVYQDTKTNTSRLEAKILEDCHSLSKNTSRYDYYWHSIQRRAIVSHHIETAYGCTAKSVDYFTEKQESDSGYYTSELFYSLVNHAATSRYHYKYQEAWDHIQKASDLFDTCGKTLYGTSMKNTMAIIAFETEQKTAMESIDTYLNPLVKDIDISYCTESTYYIIYNNIGCLYALQGKKKEADEALSKAFKIMNNGKKPIKNHSYMLNTNKAVIEYVFGDKQQALKWIRKAKGCQTYVFSDHYLMARCNHLEEIMKEGRSFSSIQELNEYMCKIYVPQNDCGYHFNKSLLLWSLEYWTK